MFVSAAGSRGVTGSEEEGRNERARRDRVSKERGRSPGFRTSEVGGTGIRNREGRFERGEGGRTVWWKRTRVFSDARKPADAVPSRRVKAERKHVVRPGMGIEGERPRLVEKVWVAETFEQPVG
jgi:hypothetical protein